MEHLDPSNASTLQWFASLGVGGVLALFMFVVYRKDIKQFADLWQAQSGALLGVIKDNTAAISALTATIQALHRRDDRIEEALNRMGYTFPHRPPETQ